MRSSVMVDVHRNHLVRWRLTALYFTGAFLIAGVFGACGHVRLGRHTPAAGDRIVINVTVEGNDSVATADLVGGLATHSDNFGSFDEKPLFSGTDVVDDYARLQAAVMDYGHFEAVVLRHRVEPDADNPNLVRIVFEVNEGPGTLVTSIKYNGLPVKVRDAVAAPRLMRVASMMRGLTPYKVGDVWRQVDYQRGAEAIRAELRTRGFIYAEVVGQVDVSRKSREAKVTYGIVPGPLARIENIEVLGAQVVSPERIMRRVGLKPGQPVDPTDLRDTEEDIVNLGVFFSVTAKPRREPLDVKLGDLAPTYENLQKLRWDPDVTVTITVQERPVHELKAGGGLSLDQNTSEFRLLGEYSNRNFIGNQRFLSVSLIPSYWLKPRFWDFDEHGPGGKATITFRQPSFLEEYLTLEASTDYEVDIGDARRAHEVGSRLGLSRRFWRQLTGYIGYEIKYEAPYEVSTQIVGGQDLTEDKLLTYFEQRLEWDRRDSVLDPRNGWSASLTFRESLPELGSAANFLFFKSELRGYWQFWKYLGIAVRAHWSMNLKIADDDPPYGDWIKGGGATDMRGYASEGMGPFACDGDLRDVGDVGCAEGETVVRDGGNAKALFSFEARVFLPAEFGIVAFVDVGQIWTFPERTDFSTIDVAVGPGLRYYTVIGPIGLDFGFLLTQPNPENVVVHINIGQSF
ncbi:MAG: outer membrane protein assembly factor BamA [Myxococcota bacterium]|jgi:outer membrane protein assembly factor BamA